MTTSQPVEFEVAPSSLGYAVAVQLRNVTGRWVATAQAAGDRHIGLGATAREALASALVPLGPLAASILLADPALFGASVRVRTA